MPITVQEYNDLIDEYEATHADLVRAATNLAISENALQELRAEFDTSTKELAKTRLEARTASSKLIQANKEITFLRAEQEKFKIVIKEVTALAKQATTTEATTRNEVKRLKEQVKRHKDKPVRNDNSGKLKQLREQLEMCQGVLRKSAIYIGSFTDHRGIGHSVYDDHVCTMETETESFRAHRTFVVDQYGIGRVCYRRLDDNSIHVCKAHPSNRFQNSKALDDYLNGYFKKFDLQHYQKHKTGVKQ